MNFSPNRNKKSTKNRNLVNIPSWEIITYFEIQTKAFLKLIAPVTNRWLLYTSNVFLATKILICNFKFPILNECGKLHCFPKHRRYLCVYKYTYIHTYIYIYKADASKSTANMHCQIPIPSVIPQPPTPIMDYIKLHHGYRQEQIN